MPLALFAIFCLAAPFPFPNRLLYDPAFHKKPIDERIAILSEAKPEFRSLPRDGQVHILDEAEKRFLNTAPATSDGTTSESSRNTDKPSEKGSHNWRYTLLLAVLVALICLAENLTFRIWLAEKLPATGRFLSRVGEKVILAAGLVGIVFVGVYPPWKQTFRPPSEVLDVSVGPTAGCHHWIFAPPGPPDYFWGWKNSDALQHFWSSELDVARLCVEWVVILLLTAVPLVFTRKWLSDRNKSSGGETGHRPLNE